MDIPVPQKRPVNKKKRILFLLFLLVGFNAILFGAFYFSFDKTKLNSKVKITGQEQLISPTPFLFQEMTIPYLRSRQYQSSLGQLNQATETFSYIGYLTNYDSDGFRINGYLTIPKGNPSTHSADSASSLQASSGQASSGGWPAIVFVHGYIPPQNYSTLENYSAFVDFLAKNGFVVFKIDLRGHGNSEGEPGGGYYSSDYIIDTLNARAALSKADFVNPDAIGLWGHSMAGNVVSRALAARPEISAISIFAGAVYTYSDFSQFRIQDSSYHPQPTDSPSGRKRNEIFQKHGQFDPDSEFWKQVPMTNYLQDIKGAIQLNHAADDGVVDIGYSRNLNSLLNKTSIQHELNEYPTGGHNFTGATFNQSMQNAVDFFKTYLK